MSNTQLYILKQNLALTHDIALLSLTPLSQALHYKAGQYVEILLRSGDCLLLSIANAPTPDGRIDFHLRHDTSHPLASVFLNELENAPTVALRGPFGVSTLDQTPSSEEMLVFLAGGTGFAPIRALLEIALTENRSKLILYWGIKRPEDAYDVPLLQQWKQRYPHFEYTLVLSDPSHCTQWDAPTGLVHDYVAKVHADMKDLCLFASGPYEMIKAAQELFSLQGLSPQRFISDMAART